MIEPPGETDDARCITSQSQPNLAVMQAASPEDNADREHSTSPHNAPALVDLRAPRRIPGPALHPNPVYPRRAIPQYVGAA